MNEDRLRTLALDELRYLAQDESTAGRSSVTRWLRLESEARSVFLLEDHEPGEARGVLSSLVSSLVEAWRALLIAEEPGSSRLLAGPHTPEEMMTVWDVTLGGLWTAVALDDRESISRVLPRILAREPQDAALAQACIVQARQIYLLYQGHGAEAGKQQRESWQDWLDLELVHADDETWAALRGIAESDARVVRRSLEELSRKRALALDLAIEGGAMLRAIPARLVLETDAAALVRLAQIGGLQGSLEPSALLTRRAWELWRLD